jgi:hypothetical protein
VTDFDAMLKKAKLPESTVPICLRGDLVAEHEDLVRQLDAVKDTARTSLADGGTSGLAERIRELEAEMKASTYVFRLRALAGPRFAALKRKHPPRESDEGQVLMKDLVAGGVNVEEFAEPLIRASVFDPKLSDGQWRELLGDSDDEKVRRLADGQDVEDGKLSAGQIDELFNAAWALNQRSVDVPFSSAASRIPRTTEGG